MSFNKTTVQDIAWLARLAIDDQSIAGYEKDLTDILALVERMKKVNTADIQPLAHPLEIDTQLRPDAVTEENQRDDFQKIAPAITDGHYLVPKFVE